MARTLPPEQPCTHGPGCPCIEVTRNIRRQVGESEELLDVQQRAKLSQFERRLLDVLGDIRDALNQLAEPPPTVVPPVVGEGRIVGALPITDHHYTPSIEGPCAAGIGGGELCGKPNWWHEKGDVLVDAILARRAAQTNK